MILWNDTFVDCPSVLLVRTPVLSTISTDFYGPGPMLSFWACCPLQKLLHLVPTVNAATCFCYSEILPSHLLLGPSSVKHSKLFQITGDSSCWESPDDPSALCFSSPCSVSVSGLLRTWAPEEWVFQLERVELCQLSWEELWIPFSTVCPGRSGISTSTSSSVHRAL